MLHYEKALARMMAVAHWWPGVPPVYSIYFILFARREGRVSNERIVKMEVYKEWSGAGVGECKELKKERSW